MSQARIHTPPPPRRLPSLTMLAFLVMLACTLAGIGWAAAMLSDPASLPIRKVLVTGDFRHLDPGHLKKVVAASVHGGFFGVDVAKIQASLLDQPWIADATIRRVWPDTLEVTIAEQTAIARWGDRSLLNPRGDVFTPAAADLPRDLVRLAGPVGSAREVLREYHYIRERLATVGLRPVAVKLSERHAWTVTTSGGQDIVLGRRDLETRVARFIYGYTRGLNDAWARIRRVDMRYTNGFAVGERPRGERNG